MKVSLFEIFLIQVALYTALWLIDEYVASYMSVVIPAITAALLGVVLLAEIFDRSRVPPRYFWFMGITIFTPVLVGLSFLILYDFELAWMRGL